MGKSGGELRGLPQRRRGRREGNGKGKGFNTEDTEESGEHGECVPGSNARGFEILSEDNIVAGFRSWQAGAQQAAPLPPCRVGEPLMEQKMAPVRFRVAAPDSLPLRRDCGPAERFASAIG